MVLVLLFSCNGCWEGHTLRVGEPVGRHDGCIVGRNAQEGEFRCVEVGVVGARGLNWGVVVACVFSSHRWTRNSMSLARLAVQWFCGGLDVNVGDVLRGSHNRLGRFTGSRGRRLDKSIAGIHHHHNIYIFAFGKRHETLNLHVKRTRSLTNSCRKPTN